MGTRAGPAIGGCGGGGDGASGIAAADDSACWVITKREGRTSGEAAAIVESAKKMEEAGAAAILLEAVPPQVSEAVVAAVGVPVIGCGAGPACHGHVFVTHDALGLSGRKPKFVPELGDLATPMVDAFREYVRMVGSGEYPGAEHVYRMSGASEAG